MLLTLALNSLIGTAQADLSSPPTSYIGATMLEGNVDFTFTGAASLDPEENPNQYALTSQATPYM